MSDKRSLVIHLIIGSGYSVFGSLGFLFFLDWWLGLLSWTKYPRYTPFAIATGLACLAICIVLLMLHIWTALKKPKPKFWLVEIPVVLLTFIPLLFLHAWVIEWLREIF